MAPFVLGSLGVKSFLRYRSPLGAVVSRAFYVTARSWEPWCSERVTSLFVLGALAFKAIHVIVRTRSPGVQSFLRRRSYWEPER